MRIVARVRRIANIETTDFADFTDLNKEFFDRINRINKDDKRCPSFAEVTRGQVFADYAESFDLANKVPDTFILPRTEDTPTAPHLPWQNPICERVNGTLRRECLNHVIILNETHLRAVLPDYIDNYYNVARTHMSLNKDSPVPRPVQPHGKIVSKPILGGLHHVYTRVA